MDAIACESVNVSEAVRGNSADTRTGKITDAEQVPKRAGTA